MTDDGSN
jgi:hypothetical protein